MSKIEVDAIEPQSGTSLTLGASGDTVTIASGASFSSIGIDDNATSTAITIDSGEKVGIGETSPLGKLHVKSADSGVTTPDTGADDLIIESSTDTGMSFLSTDTATIRFNDADGSGDASYQYRHDDRSTRIVSAGSERMRIDSNGDILIGKTASALGTAGVQISSLGSLTLTRSGSEGININRTTNDGNLIRFYQDGAEEGNISVSGATVAYNGFTGTHWSRFTDNSTPTILKGTVLESLDEMCDWYNLEFDVMTQDEDGNDVTTTEKIPHILADGQSDGDVITYNHEGTDVQATIVKETDIKHVKSKVSDTVDAKNIYGVFMAYDEDGEGYNDFYVASVGSFVVRIKQGETVAKGDLLQSNGDGTAKVQADDLVRASSFAKVLSNTVIETYEDGSFIVPCSLMC